MGMRKEEENFIGMDAFAIQSRKKKEKKNRITLQKEEKVI